MPWYVEAHVVCHIHLVCCVKGDAPPVGTAHAGGNMRKTEQVGGGEVMRQHVLHGQWRLQMQW